MLNVINIDYQFLHYDKQKNQFMIDCSDLKCSGCIPESVAGGWEIVVHNPKTNSSMTFYHSRLSRSDLERDGEGEVTAEIFRGEHGCTLKVFND